MPLSWSAERTVMAFGAELAVTYDTLTSGPDLKG